MGTGIGKYCKRCGEQLNYDDGFEEGFCNRCYHIVKQEEWREIDKDIRYEIGGKRYVSINGEEYVRTKDISKLLSERQQKGWMEGFDEGTSLEKELSNLLKVEK
jgi:predicted HD phosphohydrolase